MGEGHTFAKYVKSKMKIGVTGIIGSGKSTVVKYLESLGYSCFDCDKYAHMLLTNQAVIAEVSKHFDCLEDGQINRKLLGAIVFNDQAKLAVLNSILHPLIIEKIKSLDEPVFVDIPLLYEAKMEEYFDVVIAVLAPNDVLIERLSKRNNLSKSEAISRISLQIDQEVKKNRANYVIINNDTISSLYKKVDQVLEEINV